MRNAIFVVLVALTATTCGGGTGGRGDRSTPAAPAGTFATFIEIQGHLGTFALTLGTQTISTDGDHQFNVPAGVQQVTGTLTVGPFGGSDPSALQIFVHGAGGSLGGPQSGSLQSTDGPRPVVDGCNLSYANSGATAQTFPVKFQFTVSASGRYQRTRTDPA